MVNLLFFVIAIIISFSSILSYLIFFNYLYVLFFEKFTQTYSFKVTNLFYTLTIIFGYIGLNIIFLYYLRLFALGYTLDLRLLYTQVRFYWTILINPLDMFSKLYLLTFSIIILMFFYFAFILYNKYIYKEMQKIVIFFNGYPIPDKEKNPTLYKFRWSYYNRISWYMRQYSHYDMMTEKISYIIYRILKYLTPSKTVYDPSRYISPFVKFSPAFIVMYDCIFNAFIIQHFYYYMLIYIPVMIHSRFCKIFSKLILDGLLWQLYYNPDYGHKFFIITSTKEQRMYFNLVLKKGTIPVEFLLEPEGNCTVLLWNWQYNLIDQEQKIYINMFSNKLRIDNGKIYTVTEDDDGNNIYTESTSHTIL